MDIGMQVSCHRCTQKFQMYYETHGVGEWGKLAGMCPLCNAMVTANVLPNEKLLVYPPAEEYVGAETLPYHEGEEHANDIQ